jgi:WD40 repeat protein
MFVVVGWQAALALGALVLAILGIIAAFKAHGRHEPRLTDLSWRGQRRAMLLAKVAGLVALPVFTTTLLVFPSGGWQGSFEVSMYSLALALSALIWAGIWALYAKLRHQPRPSDEGAFAARWRRPMRAGLRVALGITAVAFVGVVWHSFTMPWYEVRTLTSHRFIMMNNSVAFSPDGRYLATGDREIYLWEVDSGRLVRSLECPGGAASSVAFSPDGRCLAAGNNVLINVWDGASGRCLYGFQGRHAGVVESVTFSPDGRYLASGSADKTVKLWELVTAREVRTLTGHQGGVTSMAFSPDGRWLASGSQDNTIRLWETETGRVVRSFEGHTNYVNSVAISPDGLYLASGSVDKTVKIWELATSNLLRTLSGHLYGVSSVAFSPDGRTLFSGSTDGTVRQWEVSTGRRICTLAGHTQSINSVAISRDGLFLASGGPFDEVKIWRRRE